MAARSSGVGGMLYSLIFFVFLFVICLALAILFYTRATEQEKIAAQAQLALKAVVDGPETDSPAYKALMAEADKNNRSLFSHMLIQAENLHRMVTGNGSDTHEQVVQKLEAVGVKEGRTAISEITTARQTAAQNAAELEKALAANKQLQTQLTELEARYKNIVSAQQDELAKRQAQIDALKQMQAAYQNQADTQMASFEQKHETMKQQVAAQLQAKDAELSRKDREIATLNVRIRELTDIIRRLVPSSPDPTLEPDGKIVGVLPEENLVYIDLGSKDRLVLGMTFEVFDAVTGPQLEDVRPGEVASRQKPGKATIQVIRIEDNTATCRVIRRSYGMREAVGDVISNLAYDAKRVYKFFVFGDFDLDYDGKTDPNDYDVIVSMIRQWGGQVVEGQEMPLDIDFLVLGREPEMPRTGGDNFDPKIVETLARQRALWEKYQKIATQARDMSIPVLNQNRFLVLTGYSRR